MKNKVIRGRGYWGRAAVFLLLLALSAGISHAQSLISAKDFAQSNNIAYQWFSIQQKLIMRKGLKSAHFTLNSADAVVDERAVKLLAAPVLQNGSLMLAREDLNNIFGAALHKENNAKKDEADLSPKSAVKGINNRAAAASYDDASSAILVALRHSVREDHTRVVLEFNNKIEYKTELKNDIYRLIITKCRNLVPINRTNPVGKAIKKLDIKSGPNRSGLILTFRLAQTHKSPFIETVDAPFRMVISFPFLPEPNENEPSKSDEKNKIELKKEESAAEETKPAAAETEPTPEINISIEEAKILSEEFKNLVVVIDAARGGDDAGYATALGQSEKQINLSLAEHLQKALQGLGLRTVLTRSSDSSVSVSQRVAVANKLGADLFISLRCGSSNDKNKVGMACFYYSKDGIRLNQTTQGLNNDIIFKEWSDGARFDLCEFLARKINERLIKHISTDNRGVKNLPLLPLRFVLTPAVIVEAGMLSDKTESKNLAGQNYQRAVAQAIANGVADFFNGIVINP